MTEPAKGNGTTPAPSPDSAVENHNVGNRHAVIQRCAQRMMDIKARRKELNEEAGEIRQELRDMGIQTATFDLALRIAEKDQEAKSEYLDSLHENFEALGVGQTLDWIRAAADVAKETTEQPAAAE